MTVQLTRCRITFVLFAWYAHFPSSLGSRCYRDPDLQKDDMANEWLELCMDQMYKAFNRSNFQQEIHELYYDLVVFGTAALMVEGDKDGISFLPGTLQK